MTYRRDLWEVAAGNHGIVTTRDAKDAGVPTDQVRKLAGRGALERIAQGVYRHTGVPRDSKTDLAAALAAAGEGSFLEGDTVLSLWDLAMVNPVKIYVGTTRRSRKIPPVHTVVTMRPGVAERDLTIYDGLRSITVRQALVDAADRLLGERVIAAIDDALRQDLLDELEAAEVRGAVAASLGVSCRRVAAVVSGSGEW
jgi:predicted transcriptional regulator of viral defense system